MSEGTVQQVLAGEATWHLEHADCREFLASLPEHCIDAVVCDPPYELGFMGRKWDGSGVAFDPETWRAVLRVLKPGAHLLAFGGTRTMHRITTAIEDAGFDIRDGLIWHYGSGFPKSLDLAKAADKTLGHWRGRAGEVESGNSAMGGPNYERTEKGEPVTAAAAAAALQGMGTALKPSYEPIALARKPVVGTVLENVQRHGTGGINIDACRVEHAGAEDLAAHEAQVAAIKSRGGSMENSWKNSSDLSGASDVNSAGRWPPNALFSHTPLCEKLGTIDIPAHPTWDTPSRATAPSSFTGSTVSQVRHVNGRNGEASADKRYADKGSTSFAPLPGSRRDTETVERWECVEGCPVRQLDMQSGDCHQGGNILQDRARAAERKNSVYGSDARPRGAWQAYPGEGSAARYFPQFEWTELDDASFRYLPKAARSERDAGLDQFRPRSGAEATDSEEGQVRLESPRSGAGRKGGARNIHPTVKPVELLRWLIRLVTPRGGVVLDPFAGSASCGVAALLEGVRWVGVELNDSDEEPYVSIARARLHHVEGREFIPRESLRAAEPPKQKSLFELSASGREGG